MRSKTMRNTALAKRRDQVAERYLQGWTQTRIAEELQVGVATICRDLQHVQSQWRERAVRNMDEIKAEQIAKIDWLERQATAAWFRSVQGAGSEAVPQELTPTGNAGNGERLLAPQDQVGSERLLGRLGWCVEQRLKIYGLYAPTKAQVTGKDGAPLSVPMSDNDIMRVLKQLNPLELDVLDKVVHIIGKSSAPSSTH